MVPERVIGSLWADINILNNLYTYWHGLQEIKIKSTGPRSMQVASNKFKCKL